MLVGVIVLLFLKKRNYNNAVPKELFVKKRESKFTPLNRFSIFSALKKEETPTPQQNYNIIMAQKRIRELEFEVKRLKNKGRIEEIEGHIQREKEEVNKLKRGEI